MGEFPIFKQKGIDRKRDFVLCCNCWGGAEPPRFFMRKQLKTGLLSVKMLPYFFRQVIDMEQAFLLPCGEMNIPCKLNLPSGEIRRVVLGVHGFGGSSQDEIQVGIAEEMEFFRSATLRFDFPLHGENHAPGMELSVKGCVQTLTAVAGYAKERFPEVEDLCIFATGFGAYITLIALEELLELPGKIKLVVQTPSVLMHETLLAMTKLSRETFRALDRFTVRRTPSFDITYRFYEELQENIALNTYSIPMLILHGEEDAFISMEHIQNFHRINERSELVIIPGTSHRFLEEGAWDMVLDLTRDWFEFEQVLLM